MFLVLDALAPLATAAAAAVAAPAPTPDGGLVSAGVAGLVSAGVTACAVSGFDVSGCDFQVSYQVSYYHLPPDL